MMDKPLLPDPEPIITETPGAPTGMIKYWHLSCNKILTYKHIQVGSNIGL